MCLKNSGMLSTDFTLAIIAKCSGVGRLQERTVLCGYHALSLMLRCSLLTPQTDVEHGRLVYRKFGLPVQD